MTLEEAGGGGFPRVRRAAERPFGHTRRSSGRGRSRSWTTRRTCTPRWGRIKMEVVAGLKKWVLCGGGGPSAAPPLLSDDPHRLRRGGLQPARRRSQITHVFKPATTLECRPRVSPPQSDRLGPRCRTGEGRGAGSRRRDRAGIRGRRRAPPLPRSVRGNRSRSATACCWCRGAQAAGRRNSHHGVPANARAAQREPADLRPAESGMRESASGLVFQQRHGGDGAGLDKMIDASIRTASRDGDAASNHATRLLVPRASRITCCRRGSTPTR